MTGVIYARYSSENQREESIEGQLRECKAFAEKNGIQIVGTYIDRALSAKTDNRPDFQRMIKDSAKQQFNTVIVWKLDRFARNRYDSAHYKSILKKNNVRVISATEAISQGAEGIILESVLEGMAEYYSAELAEKVVRGQTENALRCRFNGGTIPIGYNIVNQQFQINTEVAPHILSAYQMYDEGRTMQEIADDLNVKGVRTTRGTKLTLNTVSNLLSNRRYMGEYAYRDIVVPDGIPAIVPKDLFFRVQEKIEKNKKSPARNKADEEYILSTKLYCGKCMTFMVGESGTARNQTTYRYYKCLSAKRKRGCDKKAVRKEWIEDIVINQILKVIWDDDLIDDVADLVMEMQKTENTALPMLNKRKREIETSISNILSAIEQGIFTTSTKQRLEELESQKRDIEIEISKENISRPMLKREQIIFWFHRFRKMNVDLPENRRRLVDSFVNSIILYDDRIQFYFNFKKGAKVLSLSDLENVSDLPDSVPPENDKFRQKLVVFSYIRLTASYMYLRCVIFASQVICLRALGANIISLKPQASISLLRSKIYHSVEDGIALKTNCYVRVQIHMRNCRKYLFVAHQSQIIRTLLLKMTRSDFLFILIIRIKIARMIKNCCVKNNYTGFLYINLKKTFVK